MESVKLRIGFAVVGMIALVAATFFILVGETIAPGKAQWPYLTVIAITWAYAIPNVIKLRNMIAEQRHGRK